MLPARECQLLYPKTGPLPNVVFAEVVVTLVQSKGSVLSGALSTLRIALIPVLALEAIHTLT